MTLKPLLVVAVACSLGAVGCGRRSAEVAEYKDTIPPPAEPLIRPVATVGRYGGRFVLGQTVNPKTFNAMMATETSSSDITNLIFTTLVSFDNATQKFGPELAKSWEVAPDGVTWTFHLRKGAAFSDGHPITADDVLFSFEVAYDPVLQSIPDEHARQRLISRFDLSLTRPEWALGYRFDIVLRGRDATPFEERR